MREKETGGVNYAAELTHRRSRESARESQVCARLELRSVLCSRFHRLGVGVANLFKGPVSCLDPCSEQQVFRGTTNRLIKWDGRTWSHWLTQTQKVLGLDPALACLNSCPWVQKHTRWLHQQQQQQQ